MVPVTEKDFTPAACVERLIKLKAQPHLTFSVGGGGVENGPVHMIPEGYRLIHVDELEQILRHLTVRPGQADNCDLPCEVNS